MSEPNNERQHMTDHALDLTDPANALFERIRQRDTGSGPRPTRIQTSLPAASGSRPPCAREFLAGDEVWVFSPIADTGMSRLKCTGTVVSHDPLASTVTLTGSIVPLALGDYVVPVVKLAKKPSSIQDTATHDQSIVDNFGYGGARGGGKTATMHAQMDAMRKSIASSVICHDSATCWWCKRAMEHIPETARQVAAFIESDMDEYMADRPSIAGKVIE